MRIQAIQRIVSRTVARLEPDLDALKRAIRDKRPKDLAGPARMAMRGAHLADGGRRPSRTEFERILGDNDLVDLNYLLRALRAAQSVCRIVLRDDGGRQIGYASGFKVSPRLLLTNHHVFGAPDDAVSALAEFDYELDIVGRPRATTAFAFKPADCFLASEALDFALVALDATAVIGTGRLDDYGFLRLNPTTKKVNKAEYISIIQHPSGLPKQVALRENQLLDLKDHVLWYQSDTAQGSSGSPLFNDSWQVLGLHHSGVPRRDDDGRWLLKSGEPAGPDADDADIDWIANEGIRASYIVEHVAEQGRGHPLIAEFLELAQSEERGEAGLLREPASRSPVAASGDGVAVTLTPGGARVTLPVSINLSLEPFGLVRAAPEPAPVPAVDLVAVERSVQPYVDPDYGNRVGYDEMFLGIALPLPEVTDLDRVARLDNGNHVIPYEHFSIVMDKERRLALLTVSNVDGRLASKQPEPGRDYSRKGLGGLGENDIELWLTDPRIPAVHQLPDRFFSKDRGAFDRGHIVRREDVCWGASYQQIRRANGDTFHTTNCSPQVAGFNQSSRAGLWGRLENFILEQAASEVYSILAGPVLAPDDRVFAGVDDAGAVRVKIPSKFWKVVVARKNDVLQSFGFLLEQDLSDVPLEFQVDAEWRTAMIAIPTLEAMIGAIRFPAPIHDADQFATETGGEIRKAAGIERYADAHGVEGRGVRSGAGGTRGRGTRHDR